MQRRKTSARGRAMKARGGRDPTLREFKERDLGGDIESAGTAVVVRPQRPTSILLSVTTRSTARSGSACGVEGFGDCECDQATDTWRAAAQLGGSSSARRRCGQPSASFWKTSVRYASGSMSASMQVEMTV